MKIPNSPLPWVKGNDRKYAPNVLRDGDGYIVLAPMGKRDEAEANGDYAEQAINHFPTAVELLRLAASELRPASQGQALADTIDAFLGELSPR
jgi:hypothetical protein